MSTSTLTRTTIFLSLIATSLCSLGARADAPNADASSPADLQLTGETLPVANDTVDVLPPDSNAAPETAPEANPDATPSPEELPRMSNKALAYRGTAIMLTACVLFTAWAGYVIYKRHGQKKA